MNELNEEQRRKIIIQYKQSHPESSNNSIALYMKELGIGRSTTYNVLNMYDERGHVERSEGSGRPAVKMDASDKSRLCQEAQSSSCPSQNRLADKFGISQQYVNKILHEGGLKSFKKIKSPAVSNDQKERQRLRIGRLYRHLLTHGDGNPSIVMDDEAYFEMYSFQMPGNDHYYASARGDGPSDQIFAPKAKFTSKILVWIAISNQGISKPYLRKSKHGAVNGDIYANECLRKRLKPFIDEYHNDQNYLFWPDLASCHYGNVARTCLEDLEIQYVDKDMNPPNSPQLRPIESFWGLLKQEVYCKGWKANDLDQLERRVRYCLGKIDRDVVCRMMDHVKSKLRKARESGIESLLK